MSDIKSIILLLCKTINKIFDVALKPEYFRIAKFDKPDPDVISIFWEILYKCNTPIPNYTKIQTVKLNFASLHYKNIFFYSLPEDASYGTRELLIAFAWLISKHNILDKLLKQELSKSKLSQEFHIDVAVKDTDLSTATLSTLQDYMNYLLWIIGKVNTNLKLAEEYNNKTLELTAKINKQNDHKLGSLSIAELSYIGDDMKLSAYLKEIERVSQILDYVLRWKDSEKPFWDWMLSVAKEKASAPKKSPDKENIKAFFASLREHAKNVLNPDKKYTRTDSFQEFPRCILSTKPDTDTLRTIKNNVNLNNLQTTQLENINKIDDFLLNYIKLDL